LVNPTTRVVEDLVSLGEGFTGDVADVRAQRFRHDLRQPMVTVSLLVNMLTRAPGLRGEALERLAEVQRQVDWMVDLLRTQEDDADVRVVDIGETIADHCTAGASGCDVRFVQTAPAHILVDPLELTRAARNLLDNATRAVGGGGTVEVRVSRSESDALLEVTDSGPGFGRMAPQQGHGLASVRRFAERYGGGVTLGTSGLGGAKVTIRLPLSLARQGT